VSPPQPHYPPHQPRQGLGGAAMRPGAAVGHPRPHLRPGTDRPIYGPP
jgi:hypothetical protein